MTELAISTSTKSAFAYERVRERILRHHYPPGDRINQALLAVELGISTTPLREALRRLSAEGLVELRSHSDARVARLSAEEARDLLELRSALDPLAVRLAAERRTRADIDTMRAAASGMVALPDQPSTDELAAHRAFHASLYRASHNQLLVENLDALWDKADRYRLVGLTAARDDVERSERTAEHHALLEAIIGGDGVGAEAIMRRHIRSSLGAKAATFLGRDEGGPQ